MKKKLALSLAILMVAVLAVTAVASAQIMYVKTGNGKTLNVRSNPWKADNNIMAQVAYGTALNVEYYVNSTWACVTLATGSDEGFVQTQYLVSYYPGAYVPTKTSTTTNSKYADESYSSFRQVENYKVTVCNSRSGAVAKLRWAPSKSAALVDTLYAGDSVTVLAEGKNWYQVQDDKSGAVGFINTNFLNLN